MRHITPRKAALIFTAILFSVVIIYFAAAERVEDEKVVTPKQTAFAVISEITALDSDGDGLRDWEEELWKSDPHNPDTDGDGTNDNDEVSSGRSPVVAGPDDVLENGIGFFDNTESIHKENTKIDILAQDLFVDYIDLKKQNNLNTKSEQELVERLINESAGTFDFSKYTTGSFTTVENGEAADAAYKASIDLAFTDFSKVTENELVVLTNALDTNDSKEFEKLDFSIEIYSRVITNLTKTHVPNNARFIHADLLNGLNYFTEIIKDMRNVEGNTVSAIAAVNGYFDGEDYLLGVLTELNTYFEKRGLNK